MMNSVNELVDDVLWRELVQHLERRKSTVSYRRPIVDLKLHYVVTDKTNDDKIVKKSGIRNAHSLLANFLAYLGCYYTTSRGIFNIGGSEFATANNTAGIVVGNGTQTKSVLLIDLASPIKSSTTSLYYNAESYLGPISINNNASAVMREIKSFTNNSTTSISLTEIGVYGTSYGITCNLSGFNSINPSSIFGNGYVLLAYDLLSPSVVIQPSQTITFEYDWIVNV